MQSHKLEVTLRSRKLSQSQHLFTVQLLKRLTRFGLNPEEWILDWNSSKNVEGPYYQDFHVIQNIRIICRSDRTSYFRGKALVRLDLDRIKADWIQIEIIS